MDSGPASPRDLEPVARLCGAAAIALGLAILIGWATGLEELTRIAPALPAATPNSAIMFVACGVALRGRLVIPCGALVVAIAGATLIEHATGASLGLDNLFGIDVPEVAHPGRPATHTAAAFLLLGLSLLVTGSRSRAGDIASGALTAGAAAVIGLAVAGYLVGVDYLLGNSSAHGMSAHTAAGLVVVLVGVFALRGHTPPAAWYVGAGAPEAAARSLMLPGLIVPFAAAGLAQLGAISGLYSERFALSLTVVGVAAMIQAMIYRAVGAVREHEAVRMALERESRANVERFSKLTHEAPVGIFEADAAGSTTFVNERFRQITGLSEEETLAGLSAIHPDDRLWVRPQWRKAAQAGLPWDAEFRIMRPDGEVRWVACHASPLAGEDGEVTSFLGSMLDITERKLAEERTGMVVSRIAEAVSVLGPDGNHVHVNEAGQAILADLQARYADGPLAEQAWGALDADGNPLASDRLPAEVTRLTGRAVDDCVVGFPSAAAGVRWLRISTRRMSDEGPPYTVIASFADVTEQRLADARLAEAQKRFELAFDDGPIGLALVALDGRLMRVNQALCRMFGRDQQELLESTFQELTPGDELPADLEQLGRVFAGEISSYTMQKRYEHKDGSHVWAQLSVSLVRDDDDQPLEFIAQIVDVTDRHLLEAELRHQADHDNLTGLSNRRAFSTALAHELARERRYGGEFSLLMVDLDGFKEINDTEGHAAGDLMLQGVANTIADRVRDTDIVARLGGDEFAVLLPGTRREGAEVLAIDLVQALRELRIETAEGREVASTASIGLACSGELPEDRDEDVVMAAADLAMYDAKRTGRDRYAVHAAGAGEL